MSNPEDEQDIVEPQESNPSSSKASSTTQARTLRERKKRVVHVDKDPDNDEDEYEDTQQDDFEPLPQSKKRKTGKGTTVSRPRKKGKLASLPLIMPIEVLCEIYSYLSPLDLIHIARAAKPFALFLLHPSAATIWRTARLQLPNLPDIHEDLSEQQFANLLFGYVCNRCGKGPIRKVNWILRRRWCEACRDEILRGDDPHYSPPPYYSHSVKFTEMAYIRGSRRHGGYVIDVRKLEAMDTRLDGLCDDPTAQEKLREEYVAKTLKLTEHVKMCESWKRAKDGGRAQELYKIRQERRLNFKARLAEIGWSDEVLNSCNWHEFPTMKQSKVLTETDWEKLRPQAERLLAEKQSTDRATALEILSGGLRSVYRGWLKNQLVNYENFPSLPSPDWISANPRVMEVLTQHAEEHTLDIIYRGSFDPPEEVTELFSEIIKTWRDEVTKFFRDALPLSHRLPVLMDSFNLAISVFRCERVYDATEFLGFHYPELGQRACGRPSDMNEYYDHLFLPWPSEKWWKFDEVSSHVIRQILVACQLDPATTTVAAMNVLDPRVVCKTCSPPGSGYGPTMTWKRALYHWDEKHKQSIASESTWRMLDSSEKSALLETPTLQAWESLHMANIGWRCGLCPWSEQQLHRRTKEGLVDHLIVCHDTLDPKNEALHIRDPSALLDLVEPPVVEWNPKTM